MRFGGGRKTGKRKRSLKLPVAPRRFTIRLASRLRPAPTASGVASGSFGTRWAANGCGVVRLLGSET